MLSNPDREITVWVPGHPVQWKQFKGLGRRASSPRECTAWREKVRLCCKMAASDEPVQDTPSILHLKFFLLRPDAGKYAKDEQNIAYPDLTDLVKLTEDGLQGVLLYNDKDVFAQSNAKVFVDNAQHEGVLIFVQYFARVQEKC